MTEIRVSADRPIAAPPDEIYAYIADYQHHHRQILPSAFSDFRVEEGGTGAGTIVGYRLKAGGRDRAYRMRVAEPESGRVLTESDLDSSLVTTFTVTPQNGGSLVRIETRWQGARGIGGFFERTFAPRVLRQLYEDELAQLESYALTQRSRG
jgi:hypothetical protein